jgi:hypothetical protein
MGTLHSILVELGLEDPEMHQKWDFSPEAGWVSGEGFVPVEGKSYDLAYGKIFHEGEQRHVVRKVRIDGLMPEQWIDIDTGRALDRELQAFPVKAYREVR